MAGMNPVASGILTGGASGAATGAMIGSAAGGVGALPGAAIGFVAGAIMGGAAGSEKQKADMAAKKAAENQYETGIANQNALTEDNYNKKRNAKGLEAAVNGEAASQTGAVLTSPTGNTTNILG